MKISIVTATYNRANKLPDLYNSLKKNRETYTDFEWVIMDDGSVDNTKELINKYQKENVLLIKYYYQENQGKMRAINNVLQYTSGDIIMEIDSDDYLTDKALKIVNEDYKMLDKNAYGIIYIRKMGDKEIKSNKLHNKIIRLFDIHNTYGYSADMSLTFRADVRKKYSYPLEKEEKFITEARLYYKIDQDYLGLLFKDEEIVKGSYLEDGYSKNIQKIFKSYPYGYLEYFRECLNYTTKKTLFRKRLYFIKHYILFSFLTNKSKKECILGVKNLNKLLVMLLVIPGYGKARKF